MTIDPQFSGADESPTCFDEYGAVFIIDDTHPDAAIVHVFGEATFADTDAFDAMMKDAARMGRPVIIDLLECTYMDCATISVIVRAASYLGNRLHLVMQRSSQNYRILELTGLTRVLHIVETLDPATLPHAPARLRAV